MKVDIRSAKHKGLKLYLPTRLVLNGLTAFLFSHRLKHHTGKKLYTARQLRRLFRAIHKERKRLGSTWELMCSTTHNGTQVHITL